MKIKADYANAPMWKDLTVKSSLPEELKCLDEIAHNMWWVWNYEARDLFRDLDPELYHEVKHNPVMLLERLSFARKEQIVKDKALMKRIKSVYDLFHKYIDVEPDKKRPSVAYFCMEYGIHSALKIYSGGLGMLAGDYVKEASDSNVDMCAVGFLYRFGYFTQSLSMEGQQVANYEAQNFSSLPIERQLDKDGNPMVIDVPYTNYQVHAYVWRVNVGRVKLYLLDTDNEMNSEFDKPITHSLYGGDWENRLKQEILLGIGGMLLLKKLGIKKDIYHCNEGHAALCNLQRLCDYIDEGMTFNQALELVRASGLYTVHTPVPAGHDYFDEGLFGKYMGGYPQKLGNHGKRISVHINGILRTEQQEALNALAANNNGVLSATTAFGKTATGIALIAKHRVNTLILVHTKALLDQWIRELEKFSLLMKFLRSKKANV